MKKQYITVAILCATMNMLSCKNTEEQEAPVEPLVVNDTITLEAANDLYGTVYRQISEVPQLKEYEYQRGGVISTNKDENGDYRYGLAQYGNDKNYVIALEEFIREPNNPKPQRKILDTLNINKLNIDEIITFYNCRLNKATDSEIIAIVKGNGNDGVEYYNQIIKAWRADPKTQKIIPIEDLKGIDCLNEGYGI